MTQINEFSKLLMKAEQNRFCFIKIWFHVKYEWKKKKETVISTLCSSCSISISFRTSLVLHCHDWLFANLWITLCVLVKCSTDTVATYQGIVLSSFVMQMLRLGCGFLFSKKRHMILLFKKVFLFLCFNSSLLQFTTEFVLITACTCVWARSKQIESILNF